MNIFQHPTTTGSALIGKLWMLIAVLAHPAIVSAQIRLPTVEIIAQEGIRQIDVYKVDSLNGAPKDSKEMLFARVWFRKDGQPDSLINYVSNERGNRSYYTYNKKGELLEIREPDQQKVQRIDRYPDGRMRYQMDRYSILRTNWIDPDSVITNMRVGSGSGDSSTYTFDRASEIAETRNWRKGQLSHVERFEWKLKDGIPDSLIHSFEQYRDGANRMPSFTNRLKLSNTGEVIPPADPDLEMFPYKRIRFSDRIMKFKGFRDPTRVWLSAEAVSSRSKSLTLTGFAGVQGTYHFRYEYQFRK